MIIYVLTIFFVAIFWHFPVNINCFNQNFVLPFSLIVLLYLLSIYIVIKFVSFFKALFNSLFNNQTKIDKAKEKCINAMFEYIKGDKEVSKRLWKEAQKHLSQDKLFILLNLINADFSDKEQKLDISGGEIIRNYFSNLLNQPNENIAHSEAELIDIIQKYKSPWAFRALINHYIINSDYVLAADALKQFARSRLLEAAEWRVLRANIFMQEAKEEKDKTKHMNLLRKANRLDKSVAVFELASYHKGEKNFEQARSLIENAWPYIPSIKLGKLYIELDNDVIPIHKFQHARKLYKHNKDHPISHILVATYAMESELWAISFEYLNKFKKSYPALAYMLLARLERNKSGDTTKVWNNIEKAFALVAQSENLDVHNIV